MPDIHDALQVEDSRARMDDDDSLVYLSPENGMYLERIEIKGLKLLRDFKLTFRDGVGPLKKWTVLIGRNGTGKTSVLQAIALAAIGHQQLDHLVGSALQHLPDRRKDAPEFDIEAEFSFAPEAFRLNVFPGLKSPDPKQTILWSRVHKFHGKTLLDGESEYVGGVEYDRAKMRDPLSDARAEVRPLWFAAAYGPGRYLPEASAEPDLSRPHLARLKPLFDPRSTAISTRFANHFRRKIGGSPTKARRYVKLLDKVLFHDKDLLPTLEEVERRGGGKKGDGGVGSTSRLQESARFKQRIGPSAEKIPAVALAHGHQSTIAWIADLVGHVVDEASEDMEPDEMCGLVLVDELDLYLHPTWQVRFVRALKSTFPRIQFVVTTHSPLMLASLDPREDQIVRLETNSDTGDVYPEVMRDDPRVLTSAELLRLYFEIDDVHPDETGRLVRDYRYLAANPYRSDADDVRLAQWRDQLSKAGVDPGYAPVTRRAFVRGRG